MNIPPSNASCIFVLTASYRTQDNCKHLFMFMWPVCRAALGKCLQEHLCKHAHPWGGSSKGWLTSNTHPQPLILQTCQRKCKAIPSFPNKLNPAAGIQRLQTRPLPTSKIYTCLFLAACNPLIISVGWIWDDWVRKVLKESRYWGTAKTPSGQDI